MNRIRKYDNSSALLVMILIVLNVTIALISLRYYTMEKKRLGHEIERQLTSIASVKTSQIVGWRQERLSDARYLSKNREIAVNFSELAGDTGNTFIRRKLFDDLHAMFLNGKYEAMLCIDRQFRCFFSIPSDRYGLAEASAYTIGQAMDSVHLIMGDWFRDGDGQPRMEIAIPVTQDHTLKTFIIGWIILRINPETEFLPFLHDSPIPFKTLNVLLVRRHGKEEVLFSKANNPEIEPGDTLAAMMTGNHVLVASRNVPDSNWSLIVNLEKSEAYAELREIRIIVAIITVLLIIALTSSILLFWKRQKGEMKMLEQKQKMLTERYDWLSQYANDAIILYNDSLVLLQVNDKALEKYGYTLEEMMGLTMDKLRSPATRDELKDILNEIKYSGGRRYETIHQRKDGSAFPVEVSTMYVNTSGSNCFQSIIRDITERKKIEKALIDSEERLRLITNSVPQIVWTAKPDGLFDFINSRFEAITGRNPFSRTAIRASLHADDTGRLLTIWQHALQEGNTFQFEFRLRMKDDSYRWFLNMGIPFRDRLGNLVKWFGSATDIDDLKRTEQELNRRELLLRHAVNNLPSSFTVYDDQGRIEYINDFSLVLSDLTAEEAIGKREEDIFPEEVTRNYLPVLYNTFKTKEPQVIECLIQYSNAPRYVIYHFVPTLDENNCIYKVLGMAYDITERKSTEEKLRTAMQKAEESDRLKSAFLANISHEVRTPLNAIMGFSQMIQKTFRHDEQLRSYTDIIITSAQQLLDVIKQMIEISQLESGVSNANPAAFSLPDLMHEIYQSYLLQEGRKIKYGLQFEMEMDPLLRKAGLIISDREKLSSVIRNLLGNAFKFTQDHGSISFGCQLSDNAVIRFFVKDTGIGIEESKQEVIFSSFRQADESYTRNFGGIGLGLAICRNLVGILGGKIWVESKPGKGSAFFFTIPYQFSGKSVPFAS